MPGLKQRKGPPDPFGYFKQRLRKMPVTVAHETAKRASPALTQLTQTAYRSGKTVREQARPLGVGGDRLSLMKSGAVASHLRFETLGRVTRCFIPTDYARYLIGKYEILPMGSIPTAWFRRLEQITDEVGKQEAR